MKTKAKDFFTKKQKLEIKKAILNAELDTSGEIRVHIENQCRGDALDRASYLFGKLGMNKTDLHNGVLFYLAISSKRFAILGDSGINKEVPENFWEDIKIAMAEKFKTGDFTQGLVDGITMAGFRLKKHYPHHIDDINELPDEISFGE
jgi:uncharacterized membrane protein